MREQLLDRMIRIYGFENPHVIAFGFMIESDMTDTELEKIVENHENNPDFDDDGEEK